MRISRFTGIASCTVVVVTSAAVAILSGAVEGGFSGAWGSNYRPAVVTAVPPARTAAGAESRQASSRTTLERLRYWNSIAIDSAGLDHTPVAPGDNRVFGEQLGPGRSSRAMAIVHVAMFEAINALVGEYRSYTGLTPEPGGPSMDAAIAQAGHDALAALYPSQRTLLDGALRNDLRQIGATGPRWRHPSWTARGSGLRKKSTDGSNHAEPRVGIDFITSNEPGKWRQDPVSRIPLALGAHWGQVKPFVIRSGAQFRVPAPPALTSRGYATAFEEVKRVGGDGNGTPTARTSEQSFIGVYWAYDGTPSLCAPPRCTTRLP